MRRAWSWLFMLAYLAVFGVGTVHAEADLPPLPAKAYVLMDAATGKVLVDEHGDDQLEIASITKIMTATIALEKGNLSDVVTAGQKPYDTGGTTIYLDLGEQQTLENLLYALMLESANDAAVAIAEHIGGTEEKFVDLMNEKAREIGAVHTHFANSHGLHDPNHYSTAHDMALITQYALQNPMFRTLITTEEKEIPGFKTNPPRKLVSHNRLLGYYDGITGVKNGFTEEAGLTNVASARRGNTELIAVVLGAQNYLWTSCMTLLDYGFSHYETRPVVQKGDAAGTATVQSGGRIEAVVGGDLAVTVPKDAGAVMHQVVWDTALKAPLAAGAHLGDMQAVYQGQVIGSVPVVAPQAVPATTLMDLGLGAAAPSQRKWSTTGLALLAGLGAAAGLAVGARRLRRK